MDKNQAYSDLANAYKDAADWRNALRYLDESIRLGFNKQVVYRKGFLLQGMGRHKEVTTITKAII